MQIAISILAHTRTIQTKPISVPVVWPDSGGGSYDTYQQPYYSQNRGNRRIEAINDRPNSNFNRLVFDDRGGHNFQNANSQDSVDYVDRTSRLTNDFAVQGGNGQNYAGYGQNNVGYGQNYAGNRQNYDDVEGRTKFLIKKKLKKKRRKNCLPVGYRNRNPNRIRTLYDVNLIFADVNYNQYNTAGGYGCRPLFGFNSGHGVGHGQGSHGVLGSNDGGQAGNHHTGSNSESNFESTDTDTDADYDYVNQNDHGSLGQADDYDHEATTSKPIQSDQGSNNLFGGLIHGIKNSIKNQYNQGNAPASGGPLGFFGQGGLFDFFSNGGQQPASGSVLGDSIEDTTIRPVIEINVPDTIQDVVG